MLSYPVVRPHRSALQVLVPGRFAQTKHLMLVGANSAHRCTIALFVVFVVVVWDLGILFHSLTVARSPAVAAPGPRLPGDFRRGSAGVRRPPRGRAQHNGVIGRLHLQLR